MANDRSAALLVRVWLEDGPESFRARVTAVGREAAADDATVAVASSPGDVVSAVRAWLEEFVRLADAPEERRPLTDR